MKLVGLTGGIASGKSTVAAILRRLGAAIINADELSREVVQPEQEAWEEIIKTFGPDILQEDKTLDRRKLRKIVFDNPEARKKLEAIIHPRVRALAESRISELAAAGSSVIVYEVPLLFEAQIHLWLRPVILVACARGGTIHHDLGRSNGPPAVPPRGCARDARTPRRQRLRPPQARRRARKNFRLSDIFLLNQKNRANPRL